MQWCTVHKASGNYPLIYDLSINLWA